MRSLLIALIFPLLIGSCIGFKPVMAPNCTVQVGQAKWQLEVAQSEEAREKGLMFRRSMPENQGMIFVFESPRTVAMWMKDTYLSLDMIFVDKDMLVAGVENAKALSEDILHSPGKVAYVIELNAGQAQKYNINHRDRVDLSQCPALATRKP